MGGITDGAGDRGAQAGIVTPSSTAKASTSGIPIGGGATTGAIQAAPDIVPAIRALSGTVAVRQLIILPAALVRPTRIALRRRLFPRTRTQAIARTLPAR